MKVSWICHNYEVNPFRGIKRRGDRKQPLKPHFYLVNWGLQGYIIFLISAQKLRLWVLEYPQSIFWAEIWKISDFFYLKTFSFFVVKFSIYLNRRVFLMTDATHENFRRTNKEEIQQWNHLGMASRKITEEMARALNSFTCEKHYP